MCAWTPTGCRPAVPAIFRYSARPSSIGTPNLLIRRPVEMWGCAPASMSGLRRTATRARVPRLRARASMRASSPGDSALIDRRPSGTAPRSSSGVLPTPVKTSCSGMNPARSATSISPQELASAPLPRAPDQPKQGERGVRLQRIMDGMRHAGERRVKSLPRGPNRRAAVHVGGGAGRRGDVGQGDAVARQAGGSVVGKSWARGESRTGSYPSARRLTSRKTLCYHPASRRCARSA